MRTAAIVLLCACCAAQDRATSAQENLLTEPGFHVARARASADAWTIYDSVNRARAAIKAGDNALASAQVTRALNAARSLQAAGHAADSVPIYIELVENFSPDSGAQPRISSDADRLRVGATDQAVTPISASLRSSALSLNMTGIEAWLASADAALSDRQSKTADASLASVQNAFAITSVAAELPLIRARQNLNLAAEQARQGAWVVVQTTLRTAARQLREFAETPQGQAGDAAHLAEQIETAANGLPNQHEDLAAQIEDWWDHAARLGEK